MGARPDSWFWLSQVISLSCLVLYHLKKSEIYMNTKIWRGPKKWKLFQIWTQTQINHTKPNPTYHANPKKPYLHKPNLPNQTYTIVPTRQNLPNQTHQTKTTKTDKLRLPWRDQCLKMRLRLEAMDREWDWEQDCLKIRTQTETKILVVSKIRPRLKDLN